MAESTYTMPVWQTLGLGFGTALMNLIPFTLLALLIYSPCIAVWAMQPAWLVPELPTNPDVTTIYLNLAVGLVLLVFNNMLAGALSHGVVQQLRGKRASIGG